MINESSLSEKLMSVLCSSGSKNVLCFGEGQNFTAGEEEKSPGLNKKEACNRATDLWINPESLPQSLPVS